MSDFLEPMGEQKSQYSGWKKRPTKEKQIKADPKLVRRRRVQEDMLALRDLNQQFKL